MNRPQKKERLNLKISQVIAWNLTLQKEAIDVNHKVTGSQIKAGRAWPILPRSFDIPLLMKMIHSLHFIAFHCIPLLLRCK